MRLASRLGHIEPFYVMECAKAAAELARSPECAAEPMIFLNIGEPDFSAPPLVREAAERALRAGRTQYTDATGCRRCASACRRGTRSVSGSTSRPRASSSRQARRRPCSSLAWR